MMKWETNRYYVFAKEQPDALANVSALLYAYPLTAACLDVLGQKLLEQVSFVFFEEHQKILTQGESGKDLFLLCSGEVDVLVNDSVIMQMQAPTLLGDKAIVETASKRAATIRCVKGKQSLFIKIPMGLFLRDFHDSSVQDESFHQELSIYCSVFNEVQKRLFSYINLQRSIWDEANSSLKAVNIQFLAKKIDSRQELKCSPKTINDLQKWLTNTLDFTWTNKVPLNIPNLRDVLHQLLENKVKRSAFQGKDNEFLQVKNKLWRGWLTQLGGIISRHLEPEDMPFHLDDLELFNPLNYRVRIASLLKNAEKQLKFKVVTSESDTGEQVEPVKLPQLGQFFKRGENEHEFELQHYLKVFERTFELPSPMKIQAQIAQRAALITAECENQFNTSILKIKAFLDKVSKLSIQQKSSKPSEEKVSLEKHVLQLTGMFEAFGRQVLIEYKHRGKIQFLRDITPNIGSFAKCSSIRTRRVELERAFYAILAQFQMGPQMPIRFLKYNIFLTEGNGGDRMHGEELAKNYWIIASKGVFLMNGNTQCCELTVGTMIGGKSWSRQESEQEWSLFIPEDNVTEQRILFFCIPIFYLEWEISDVLPQDSFAQNYVRTMQCLIDKSIEHLEEMIEQRELAKAKIQKILHAEHLEKSMADFEKTSIRLDDVQYQNVKNILQNALALSLAEQEGYSNKISKQMYDHILAQTQKEFPSLSSEECSNKVYTKWRFLLREIIQAISPELNQTEVIEMPQTWNPLYEGITHVLGEKFKDVVQQHNQLNSERPQLDFVGLMDKLQKMKVVAKINAFRRIMTMLEKSLQLLIQDSQPIFERAQKLQKQESQLQGDQFQQQVLREEIDKLQQTLIPQT